MEFIIVVVVALFFVVGYVWGYLDGQRIATIRRRVLGH